jgi:putative spermidine/putrescine transport system substrate-binding protein
VTPPRRRNGRLGALLLAAAALAAGCGGGGGGSSRDASVTVPARPPQTTAAGEGSLHLVLAGSPLDETALAGFEQATGCVVDQTAVASQGALVDATAAGGVDVVLASAETTDALASRGLVRPLATGAFGDSSAPGALRRPLELDGVAYGLPAAWAANVLVYRTGDPVPTLLARLFEPELRGGIAVPDDPLQIATAALVQGAKDPFSLDDASLAAAGALLRKQRALVREFWTSPADLALLFERGAIRLALAPAATVASLQGQGAPVAGRVPDGAVTAWLEGLAIPNAAPHPTCALRFLEYAATPAPQALIAQARGGLPADQDACVEMPDEKCETLGVDAGAILQRAVVVRLPLAPTGLDRWRAVWDAATE